LADIRSGAFIGITFISAAVFFSITRKYRTSFQNFYMSIWYLFVSLCCCKFAMFLLINLMKYRFDLRSNLRQTVYALLSYTFYYCVTAVREKNTDT
jgi:hypothetical protein